MLNLVIWIPQFLRTICFFSFSTVKASLNPSLVLSFLGTQRPGWPPTFIHCSFWGGFEPQQAQQGFGVQRAKLKRIFSPLLYQPEPRRTLNTRFDIKDWKHCLSRAPSIEYFLSMLVRSGHPLLCLHFCGMQEVQRTFIMESKASSGYTWKMSIYEIYDVRIYMKNVYIRDFWHRMLFFHFHLCNWLSVPLWFSSNNYHDSFLLLLGSALDFANFCFESGVTTVGIKWMVQESLVKRHGLII